MLIEGDLSGVEEVLAKNVADHLFKKYPGHLWGVNVTDGVVDVQNFSLSGRYGYRIKEENIDPDMKIITRAGGEILERYNQRRGAYEADKVAELQRNLRGDAIGDLS